MKSLFLLVFFFTISSSIGSIPDLIRYEQIALDYFVSHIDSLKFLCLNNKPFNKEVNKIYLSKTPIEVRVPLYDIKRDLYFKEFFYTDSLLKANPDNPDTIFISGKSDYIFKNTEIKFLRIGTKKNLPDYSDLNIRISSPVDFTNFKVVIIRIGCKSDWILQNLYLKFENDGRLISYRYDGGYR